MENRILAIDLSNRSYEVKEIPDKIIKNYIGGRGLGAYLLYKLVPGNADPLGEENHLIFTAGPANGTNLPYSSKSFITTKSPLTNIYLRTGASGILAHQIRKAGFWAIDIKGIADSPAYITVNNQEVDFKDASHMWGMKPDETQRVMLEGTSAGNGAAAVIGPAGEKLLPCSVIITEGSNYRTFGRGGAGCVMGSKRLKGIAICGDGNIAATDRETFIGLRKAIVENAREKKEEAAIWRQYGTGANLGFLSAQGVLPTRNWQTGCFEGWQGIDTSTTAKQWPRKNQTCAPFCITTCAHYVEINKGPYQGARSRGPEYETIYAFGSECGVNKLDAVVAAAQICEEAGIDTISAGITIGFAMECFEKGLIGPEDTDGIELRFGNDEAMISALKKIVNQEGFGNQLAKGVRKLSKEIKGSQAFAMHVKGLEMGGYECRGLNAQALQFAIDNIGGSHSAYGFPPFIELTDGSRMQVKGKGEQLKHIAISRILRDCIPACGFGFVGKVFTDAMLPDVVSSLLGEPWSADDLKRAALRIMCQERLFNMREGISREDDSLPARLLNEPKPDGPAKGTVVPLEELKDDYYYAMGWDLLSGNPTDEVLAKLEVEK